MKSKKTQIRRFIAKHLQVRPFQAEAPHPSTEQILRFFDRTSSSAERKQIETHLENCALCRELLEAVETLEETQPEEDHAKETVTSAQGLFQRIATWLTRKPWIAITVTAAAGLLIIFVLTRDKSGRYSGLVEISPAPYLPAELRGEQQDAEETFRKGMSFYLDNDFQAALPWLQSAVSQAPENAQYKFFYGMTLLLNRKYKDGIAALLDISVLESAYRDEARWYASQAYLKMNQPEKAIALLQKLAQGSSALADKSMNLLHQINSAKNRR